MPFLVALLMTVNLTPSVLTVPILPPDPDPKSIWIDALAQCESMGSTTIKVLDTNGKYSYGLLQFQMGTWLKYGGTKQNIYDGVLQTKIARGILDDGGWGNWYNCGRIVRKTLGDYPSF
jgi:hypothetical protein